MYGTRWAGRCDGRLDVATLYKQDQRGSNAECGRTPCMHAIVVSWRPDALQLRRQFVALLAQVDQLVWVDNGSGQDLPERAGALADPRVHLIALAENRGLAYAQNRGIEWARAHGATHVLLMDQDSLPQAGMVAALLRALEQAAARNERVAAVGPVCRDAKTHATYPLISRTGWRIKRVPPERLRAPFPVAYLPASGCLIPVSVLAAIGPMRAEYFIDRIDMEWCLRARRLGYLVLVVPGVEMQHDLGQHDLHVCGRRLYLGTDWRAYFHVRNSLAMALRARIPLFWRIDQLLKLPAYALLYVALARHGRWRMTGRVLRAVGDGLLNRMGQAGRLPE